MKNEFYSKYVDFLVKYGLYDEYFFKYFWDKAVHVDIRDDDYKSLFGSSVLIINKNNKLIDLVACIPFMDSDKAVSIGIYAYVHALTKTQKIHKKYNNKYSSRILPMFYERLYILENEKEELLKHEEETRAKILNGNSLDDKIILDCVDRLIEDYKENDIDKKKFSKKVKQYVKTYTKNYQLKPEKK